MKRFLIVAGLVACITTIFASTAGAVTVAVREVGWWQSLAANVSNPSAFAVSGATLKRNIDNGTVSPLDTTGIFTLQGAALPTAAITGTANLDSTSVGILRFAMDTTAAVTPNLSTIGYVLEGSGDGVNWYAIKTTASNAIVASGDCAFSINLWINSGTGYGTTGVKPSPLLTAPYLRLRFTAGTGALSAARCQLVYYQ